MIDLLGEPYEPKVVPCCNDNCSWVTYTVDVDLSQHVLHADMLYGGDREMVGITHRDHKEKWFVVARGTEYECRLPATASTSTQHAVCGGGGMKEYIRRWRLDQNRRRWLHAADKKEEEENW